MHVYAAFGVKKYSEFAGLMDISKVDRSYINTLIKAISLNLTGMSFKDIICMNVIAITDTYLTLLEKHGLAVKVVVKILMFIRTDMIF